MDKKTKSINVLPPRDPSPMERYTQTKSKGMKTDISWKWKRKKSWSRNTYMQQNRLEKQGYGEKQRRTQQNDKGDNPTRGYNPSKHLCTQHRST